VQKIITLPKNQNNFKSNIWTIPGSEIYEVE